MAYTDEQRTEAIAKVIAGLRIGTPLTVICSEEGMPGIRTVYEWRDADADLSADIARARDAGFDAIALRTRETARGSGDSKGDVQRDKLIVDTDLKLLAKWDKRYGDSVQLRHADAEGDKIKMDDVGACTRLAAIAARVLGRQDASDQPE